jgi:hypothetical protein
MSGLLALLDDVAAIAKVAATSVDDVVAQATKAGHQGRGRGDRRRRRHAEIRARLLGRARIADRVEDRARVDLQQAGDPAARRAALVGLCAVDDRAAPDAGRGLPVFRGGREGRPLAVTRHHDVGEATAKKLSGEDSAHLEEQKVKGAIKTDFILSAEIMTIALAAIETESILFEAAALAIVGVGSRSWSTARWR